MQCQKLAYRCSSERRTLLAIELGLVSLPCIFRFIQKGIDLMKRSQESAFQIAKNLVEDVYELIKKASENESIQPLEFLMEVESDWSGTLDCFNKIRSAIESKDIVATRAAAVEFAEFAIWIFLGLRSTRSHVKYFDRVSEVLTVPPANHTNLLEILLTSQDLNQIEETSAQLIELLRSKVVARSDRLPIVDTIHDAKGYLSISKD